MLLDGNAESRPAAVHLVCANGIPFLPGTSFCRSNASTLDSSPITPITSRSPRSISKTELGAARSQSQPSRKLPTVIEHVQLENSACINRLYHNSMTHKIALFVSHINEDTLHCVTGDRHEVLIEQVAPAHLAVIHVKTVYEFERLKTIGFSEGGALKRKFEYVPDTTTLTPVPGTRRISLNPDELRLFLYREIRVSGNICDLHVFDDGNAVMTIQDEQQHELDVRYTGTSGITHIMQPNMAFDFVGTLVNVANDYAAGNEWFELVVASAEHIQRVWDAS